MSKPGMPFDELRANGVGMPFDELRANGVGMPFDKLRANGVGDALRQAQAERGWGCPSTNSG